MQLSLTIQNYKLMQQVSQNNYVIGGYIRQYVYILMEMHALEFSFILTSIHGLNRINK